MNQEQKDVLNELINYQIKAIELAFEFTDISEKEQEELHERLNVLHSINLDDL